MRINRLPAANDSKMDLLVEVIRRNLEIRQNRAVPQASYKDSALAEIPIQPDASARQRKCWFNVRDVVAREGGTAIFGWTLWIRPDGHYQAIHHAVWECPNGTRIDVTPSEIDVTSVMFIADARVPFDYQEFRAPASLVMHEDSTEQSVRAFWTAPDGHTAHDYFLIRMDDNVEKALV